MRFCFDVNVAGAASISRDEDSPQEAAKLDRDPRNRAMVGA
jgi:hypothetical protein